MNNEVFELVCEQSIAGSNKLLARKGTEYGEVDDRLIQFKRQAVFENREPTEILITLMNKHVAAMSMMAKHPRNSTPKQWKSRTYDVRNYTLLLDALLKDMGID